MTLQERVTPLDLIEGTVVAKRNDSKEPHPQSPFLRLFPNVHVVKSVFPVTLNIFAIFWITNPNNTLKPGQKSGLPPSFLGKDIFDNIHAHLGNVDERPGGSF